MTTPSHEVEGPTWDMFSIVKLAHQKYAEVETKFVARHLHRLEEFWRIKKTDTDYHKLKFNKDYENPLILIQGWNKFKPYHDLPDNVHLVFIYRGNNEYEISDIYDLDDNHHIPAFHSRCLHPTETAYFDIEVTVANYIAPKIKVDSDFAEFIDKKNFEDLVLCGDDGQKMRMIVFNYPRHPCVKLGRNWDEICIWLKCKYGDVIRFKFHNERINPSNRCHVYKIV